MTITFDYYRNNTKVRSVKSFKKYTSAYKYINSKIHYVATIYIDYGPNCQGVVINGEYNIKDYLKRRLYNL